MVEQLSHGFAFPIEMEEQQAVSLATHPQHRVDAVRVRPSRLERRDKGEAS